MLKVTFQKTRWAVASILIAFVGMGCSTNSSTPTTAEVSSGLPIPALGNVEYHTHVLANELFAGLRPTRQARYAVVGFVPVDTMEFNQHEQRPLMLLGHQLEQGLITEATKRGFTTQEFKLTNDIKISDQADRVLSRDIDSLSGLERVDFYITGTLVYQEAGAVVNARVINARTKDIVAAATRFFPDDLFWQTEQVTSRGGKLYRKENKG